MDTTTNKLIIDHNNGHSSVYNLIDGGKQLPIAYYENTYPDAIIALEYARKNHTRIKIYLGDRKTGRCWNEEHDIFGYVGLSKGKDAMFPILLYNERSIGGGSIMTDNIIKITTAKGNKVLFQANNFQQPLIEIKESSDPDFPNYTHETWVNGELHGRHTSLKSAERLKAILS